MYSRDVKFNESEFGFEKESSSQKLISRVELELSSADESDTEVNVEIEPEEPVVRRSGRIRGQTTMVSMYLLLLMDRRSLLLSQKHSLAHRKLNGRRPWKQKCAHYRKTMCGSLSTYQVIANLWEASGCLKLK